MHVFTNKVLKELEERGTLFKTGFEVVMNYETDFVVCSTL